MKKLLALTVAITAIAAGRVSAAAGPDPAYFAADEGSIMIESLADRGGTIPPPDQLPKPPSGPQINPPNPVPGTGNIDGAVASADKVVNLAEKAFGIISKNQPVVNITTNYANAVPDGTTHWTQLQGWSRPAIKRYAFLMKNGLGDKVVKVTYQVHYTYNGNFQGKGKYLTGVTIEPIKVETVWGYKVSLVSEVPDSTIANVGTHEQPVAAMQLQLKWTVHTTFKDITAKSVYYVEGDGFLQEIGTPFDNAKAAAARKKMEVAETAVTNSAFN